MEFMNNLFLFLSLLSIVGLVVGLIKPSLFKQTRKRAALMFGGATILFFVLFGVTGGGSTPTAVVASTEASTTTTTSASTTDVSAQDSDATQEQQIKQLVYNVVNGTNSNGETNVREIDVVQASQDPTSSPNADGSALTGWDVKVEINIDGSRALMNQSMGEIYYSLYSNRKDIAKVEIVAFEPLIDKYGNKSDGEVYLTYLEADQAYKVDWSQNEDTLTLEILPNLWTVDYDATKVNPSLLSS